MDNLLERTGETASRHESPCEDFTVQAIGGSVVLVRPPDRPAPPPRRISRQGIPPGELRRSADRRPEPYAYHPIATAFRVAEVDGTWNAVPAEGQVRPDGADYRARAELAARYAADHAAEMAEMRDRERADRIDALECVSACNFDPLRRGTGVQF